MAGVAAAHLFEPPPRVTEYAPALPAALDAVVAKAMAKEPDGRYQSARELADAATHTPSPVVPPQSAPRTGRPTAVYRRADPTRRRGSPRNSVTPVAFSADLSPQPARPAVRRRPTAAVEPAGRAAPPPPGGRAR